MTPQDRIIVALDVPTLSEAKPLVQTLAPYVSCFKIGLELITSLGAPAAIKLVHDLGAKVFFDGKFNDIPNTIAGAARAVSSLNVAMFDVHASSGREAIEAAVENKGKSQVIAVTVLTSLDDGAAQRIFGKSAASKVLDLAMEAASAGIDGIVCSPNELKMLSEEKSLSRLIRITPGVRPSWAEAGDQKRFLTPREALDRGATMLVIGRPITNPPKEIGSPLKAIERIWKEIES